MRKWAAILLLSVVNFVMVLDSTVMNVSISAVVADLGTTVAAMQAAITFYTLTMASLMLVGGRIGGVIGRKRALLIGCGVYAAGALITGLSTNVVVLGIGWSLVEGAGAALAVPALSSLVAANYQGSDRVAAYSILGAVAGTAAAAGPLIGGFVTSYFSWRYVFLAETLIMGVVFAFRGMLVDSSGGTGERIDIPDALLSAAGFGLLVCGLLQGSSWGWTVPVDPPVVMGITVAPFGLSPALYLLLAGAVLIKVFFDRQKEAEDAGGNPLLKVSMLSSQTLRSGLSVLFAQYVVTASVFFVIPVYLQMTLGYDALRTGLEILPLSLALIVFSTAGARLSAVWSPRRIVRIGQLLLVAGAFALIGSVSADLRNAFFLAGMACTGGGLGMLASQLGNVNMSAVPQRDSAEVGGLQGVAQNLGSSLGTALIGSFLVATLTTSFVGDIQAANLPDTIKDYVRDNATAVSIVPVSQLSDYASSLGLSSDDVNGVVQAYTASQMDAIRTSLAAVVVLGVLTLLVSRGIPNRPITGDEHGESVRRTRAG